MGVETQAGRQAGRLRKGIPVQREAQGRLPAREVGHGGPGANPPHGLRPATDTNHGAPPRLPRQGRELRKLFCSG